MCTEPSNVKAGGHACPYKYVCTGCGHFRSDPSYLPELKSYLQQLLADSERLRAAADLQPWARAHAAPPDEQISQVRELIRRIEADLETLTSEDRARIENAVATIRATRQAVMPNVRARFFMPSTVAEIRLSRNKDRGCSGDAARPARACGYRVSEARFSSAA